MLQLLLAMSCCCCCLFVVSAQRAAAPDPESKLPVSINGKWTTWSAVATPCLKTIGGEEQEVSCGGGKTIRRRSCTNPAPQGPRGKQCEGVDEKSFDCNTNPCDMQWSAWSNCSEVCGRGTRTRTTMCALQKDGEVQPCKELGLKEQDFEHKAACNTWSRENCPSPCIGYNCMEFAACVDVSTDQDPQQECACQLGRMMSPDGSECVIPPPTTPTPRPIPTLAPEVKQVTDAVTRSASTILIIFTVITFALFLSLRVYEVARVIQMNQEIALVLAHFVLLIPPMHQNPLVCKIISIFIHYFFTTAFVFMLLEAIHTYSIVAYVVRKNGILSRAQNVVTGWLVSTGITLIVVGLHYDDYGGKYHCWLQVDKPLMFGQLMPITILVILTVTVIEAAGSGDDYRSLPGMDQNQLLSAKIMQRSNLLIMMLTYISFIIGVMAEYEQDVALYGTFTILNGVLGGSIFFFHCTGNEDVRERLMGLYNVLAKRD